MRHRIGERGMSLVEVLAALTVFSIVTVGVTPLLTSSLRGSNLSRARTVGRDVALQAMERVRGLPYFVSYQSQPKKVDVLDLYFPCNPTTSGIGVTSCAGDGTRSYNSGTGEFSVSCGAGVVGPSCAVPLPATYSLLYQARFVSVDGTTTVIPVSNYKRNPLPTESQLDAPPSQLMRLRITAQWTVQGRAQSFTLETIVGDRKFGVVKMSGLGRVNYGVQVLTAFKHSNNVDVSDLRALLGSAESRVETRLVAGANQQLRAAEITLIQRPNPAITPAPAATPVADPLRGVAADFSAPPTQTPTVSNQPPGPGETVMTHNRLVPVLPIAGLNPTTGSGLSVSTSNELPSATGTFGFANPGAGGGGFVWLQNQSDTSETALLKLDPLQKGVFSLRHDGSASMIGTSTAGTGAIGAADRRVQTTATLDFELLRVMPTTYLRLSVSPVIASHEAYVVMVKDFRSQADCKSVGTAASALPSPTWSATLEFWRDADQDGAGGDGSVELVRQSISVAATSSALTVDGSVAATTNLRTILAGPPYNIPDGNPLVFDGNLVTTGPDLYLFDDPASLKEGYLSSYNFKLPTASKSADGTLVSAGIDGAIRIATAPTNPTLDESGLNIFVGSLTCEALDNR